MEHFKMKDRELLIYSPLVKNVSSLLHDSYHSKLISKWDHAKGFSCGNLFNQLLATTKIVELCSIRYIEVESALAFGEH